MSAADDFRSAVRALHSEKNAAYRDAWKKRGELISVIANIARKVDRLENTLAGAADTRDESLLDTAVDLLVYSLKYQTFLADADALVAGRLFKQSGLTPPYSDGVPAFEHLLTRTDLTALGSPRFTIQESGATVVRELDALSRCFSGVSASTPATTRLEHAQALVDATVSLVASLESLHRTAYDHFVASHTNGKSYGTS